MASEVWIIELKGPKGWARCYNDTGKEYSERVANKRKAHLAAIHPDLTYRLRKKGKRADAC